MGAMGTLLRKLAGEHGIELDEDELTNLGLDADDEEVSPVEQRDDVLSQELPGTAAGMAEVFLSAESTSNFEGIESKDGLMWYPIIREGQWAVRPGQQGSKKRVPLKVVAGKSKNQRRQIGLQDLVDAFEDEAIQHVTVPTSHANTVLENTGFIKGMKIVEGDVKVPGKKEKQKVSILMGGYDFTEPDVKEKVSRGTIANRSAGILYDYVNTETGKTYPAVIEHVALTNKPWITGMISFGRKLSEGGIKTVGLSLSDEAPFQSEDEYALALSDEASLDESESDFLAQESADWSKEGSPRWLQGQVNTILRDARNKKIEAKRKVAGNTLSYVDEYPPYYRCVEAKPGTALIADGYEHDREANYWAAPIKVKDGAVEVADFTEWKSLKQAFIPDERPAPPADKLPLSHEERQEDVTPKSRLELAQEARRRRAQGGTTDPNPREVVKQDMADQSGTLQLSEEAQRAIQAAEARAQAAEARAEQLSEKVTRLTGSVVSREVDAYIGELKTNLGLTEEAGFGGVLAEVRQLMLADDGEPAVQADHFAADGNTTGELSLSESIKRIFGAFAKAQEGKAKIGEQLSQPADVEATATGEAGAEGKEGGTNASTETPAGKPGAGDPNAEAENLSADKKVEAMALENPTMAALIGGVPAATGGER